MDDDNLDPEPSDPSPSGEPGARRAGRQRALIVGAVVAVLALGSGIVWAVTRSGGSGGASAGAEANNSSSTAPPSTGTGSSTSVKPRSSVSSTSPSTAKGTRNTGGPGVTSGSSAPGVTTTPKTVKGGAPITVGPEVTSHAPVTAAPDITNAYVNAFRAECHKIWSIADGDGLLWDPDALGNGGSGIAECLNELTPGYAFVYDTVAEARQGGVEDADGAADDLTLGGRLQNTGGTRFWTAP